MSDESYVIDQKNMLVALLMDVWQTREKGQRLLAEQAADAIVCKKCGRFTLQRPDALGETICTPCYDREPDRRRRG